jgi:hypothetical protein
VTCPEKNKLEDLVAGVLPEDETLSILAHMGECQSCRGEAALVAAIRTTLPHSPAGPECLSDEAISLLRDNLLPESQRDAAISHLAKCNVCMSAISTLDRALEQAENNPVSPPAHLIKKAVAVGIPGKKASWMQRLLNISPAWRFSLAAAAAAGVFFLTILIATPTADRPDVSVPELKTASAIEKDSATSTPTLAELPAETGALESTPESVSPEAEGSDTKLAIADASGSDSWIDGLSKRDRLTMLDRAKLPSKLPGLHAGRALTQDKTGSALADAYLAGRASGALQGFSSHLDSPPETRERLAGTSMQLASLVKKFMPGKESTNKLSSFSESLAKKLAKSDTPAGTIQRRVEVLTEVLEQSVSTRPELELGYRLGRLCWELEMVATALDLGHRPPRRAWPTKTSISRVRKLLKKTSALPEQQKAGVLRGLDEIEKTAQLPPGPNKASRILDTLREVDRQVRASR